MKVVSSDIDAVATSPGSAAIAPLPIAARRHAIIREVDRQLARFGLKNASEIDAGPPATLVVGVSGGCDSVALLLGCAALAQRKKRISAPCEIVAAHVHHHLRDSADADAEYVSELAGRLGARCILEHVHPGKESGNLYANARRLRYAALCAIARRVGARHIAVAHHADDQLETMLMALCRGAGPKGMAGMRRRRELGCGVTLLRPLLNVPKEQCQDLCRICGIAWREDDSNRDRSRRRARLRAEVIPVLRALWPNLEHRAARNSESIRAAADALESEITRVMGSAARKTWPRDSLRSLAPAVVASGLQRAIALRGRQTDRISGAQLRRAADFIISNDHHPKTFSIGPVRLEITAQQACILGA